MKLTQQSFVTKNVEQRQIGIYSIIVFLADEEEGCNQYYSRRSPQQHETLVPWHFITEQTWHFISSTTSAYLKFDK